MKRRRTRLFGDLPIKKRKGPVATGPDSLSLTARKVVMASFMYYGLSKSIVADEQFDKWCARLAKRWHKLSRYEQWQLGGEPEAIRSTGYHVRVTHAAIGGALSWMQTEGIYENVPVLATQEWKYSKRHGVYYLGPECFMYQKLKELKPKKKSSQSKKKKRVRL